MRPPELRTAVELAMWLHWSGSGEPGIHLFHGGHVRLADDKRFYRFLLSYLAGTPRWGWRGRRGGSRRWSQTHRTLDDPFELILPPGWGCLLVGTHDTGTWFQSEATSVKRNLLSLIHHNVVDFLAYRITGRQQGPLGSSWRCDRSPLVLGREVCEEGLRLYGIP